MKTALAFMLLLSSAAVVFAAPLSFRASIAREGTGNATVRDRDCASTQPPAVFGCVDGRDGHPLGATGDFGDGTLGELAIGIDATPRARVELELAYRPQVDLEAFSNFLGVSGVQPVRSNGRSLSGMLIGSYDLTRDQADVRPFVLAGVGVARNETGDVTYAFPSIAPQAVTITQGGSSTGLAWTVGAGTSIALSPALAFEVALRYSDLGDWRTDAGKATIVRPTRTLELDIAGTEAELKTLGVSVSLRYRPTGRR